MSQEKSIFEMIVDGTIPSWKVWEDDNYLAFLTPFPNTPGMTVVVPKQNINDYIFDMSDEQINGFMKAIKTVAKLLEKAFEVSRVATVFEGTGVAHVHVKLYPLHGELGGRTDIWSHHQEFYPEYIGYLTTSEGPRMSDYELTKVQAKIKAAAK